MAPNEPMPGDKPDEFKPAINAETLETEQNQQTQLPTAEDFKKNFNSGSDLDERVDRLLATEDLSGADGLRQVGALASSLNQAWTNFTDKSVKGPNFRPAPYLLAKKRGFFKPVQRKSAGISNENGCLISNIKLSSRTKKDPLLGSKRGFFSILQNVTTSLFRYPRRQANSNSLNYQ